MGLNVTSLSNRRAENRWDRIAVGDMIERMTWSRPDQEALISWTGAFADKENERLTTNNLMRRQISLPANALMEKGAPR